MAELMVGRRRSLAVISTILFLTFLDNTIVSVVLAGVQSDLNAGIQQLQWVVDGYMLAFAALMLTGGTLGDIFGRKKIMLGGVVVFVAGSVMSMLAPNVDVLTAGRIIMGVGAAASEPGTLSMIRHIFSDHRSRARALGVWAAVSGAALALGPVIGGAISAAASWREIFAFNIALGLLALAAGWRYLPENADRAGRRLDITGLVLGAGALTAATFAVISGQTAGYGAWWIDALFAGSAVLLAIFLWWERRAKDAVLKLEFFRNRSFNGANVIAFATNFAVFAVFFFTALYLAVVAGFSGYDIALAFLAMAAAMIVTASFTGRWLNLHGPAVPTVVGCLLAGGGIIAVNEVMKPGVSSAQLAWTLAITGLGFGITLVTTTVLVLNIVPPNRSGMAASTFNMSRELGGVFGVAILGTIVNSQLTGDLAVKLKTLGLPHDFISLAIYAITHGGNLPANAHVSFSAIAAHPQLVQQVTDAAYKSFGQGLNIALWLSSGILFASAGVAALTIRRQTNAPASRLSERAV